jgi:hypothetical protein
MPLAGVVIGAAVPIAGVVIGAVAPMPFAGVVIAFSDAGSVCASDGNQPARSRAETERPRIGNEDSFFMSDIF